jgi:hypothetical protein
MTVAHSSSYSFVCLFGALAHDAHTLRTFCCTQKPTSACYLLRLLRNRYYGCCIARAGVSY